MVDDTMRIFWRSSFLMVAQSVPYLSVRFGSGWRSLFMYIISRGTGPAAVVAHLAFGLALHRYPAQKGHGR